MKCVSGAIVVADDLKQKKSPHRIDDMQKEKATALRIPGLSPIPVLMELLRAWFQGSDGTWYILVHMTVADRGIFFRYLIRDDTVNLFSMTGLMDLWVVERVSKTLCVWVAFMKWYVYYVSDIGIGRDLCCMKIIWWIFDDWLLVWLGHGDLTMDMMWWCDDVMMWWWCVDGGMEWRWRTKWMRWRWCVDDGDGDEQVERQVNE